MKVDTSPGFFHLGTDLGKEGEDSIVVAVISTAGDAVVDSEAEEGETMCLSRVYLVDERFHTPPPPLIIITPLPAMGTLILSVSVM